VYFPEIYIKVKIQKYIPNYITMLPEKHRLFTKILKCILKIIAIIFPKC